MEFGGILMSYSEEGLVLLVKKLAPYQFIPGKTLILPHYVMKERQQLLKPFSIFFTDGENVHASQPWLSVEQTADM